MNCVNGLRRGFTREAQVWDAPLLFAAARSSLPRVCTGVASSERCWWEGAGGACSRRWAYLAGVQEVPRLAISTS
ncbi:MAG TPA: hypothetical protein PLB24_12360, partial [Comamonas denitrificans]|nr:hypothetical protein [Comamonas denitrificans]